MQTEIKNKRLAIVFWALSVICMGVIFYFSSRTASESTEQSNYFVDWLISHFGENSLWVFIVRKSAHCLEFTGLSLLLNCAWLFTRGKVSVIPAVLCASLYAVSDEIHQMFIEGRSGELRDWAIDTVGAALGALGFIILFYIIKGIIEKKRKS